MDGVCFGWTGGVWPQSPCYACTSVVAPFPQKPGDPPKTTHRAKTAKSCKMKLYCPLFTTGVDLISDSE